VSLTPTTSRSGGSSSGSLTFISEVIVAGSPAATMDFSGISQAYTHLVFKLKTRADTAVFNQNLLMRFNNDSAANYDSTFIYTSNAAAAQYLNTVTAMQPNFCSGENALANHFNYTEITVPFYTDTATTKTIVSNGDVWTNNFFVVNGIGVWIATAAVSRVTFSLDAGNYKVGSRAMLYGLTT
jgi:hypothetical protein